jgi:RimJ/RimL family protein N-acetyltransferase
MDIFVTQRLTVRPWMESDVDRLFDMYSRDDVVRFLTSVPAPLQSPEDANKLLEEWHDYLVPNRYGFWAIQAGDLVVGTVMLLSIDFQAKSSIDVQGEVGWHLHPDSRGRGYATEATAGAIAKGFNDGMDVIYANVNSENTRSLDLCNRLGMERIARPERSDLADGAWFQIRKS